ncbi:MAG: hypothetical protein ACMUIE_07995 [Thermoplasmatota archaeon]
MKRRNEKVRDGPLTGTDRYISELMSSLRIKDDEARKGIELTLRTSISRLKEKEPPYASIIKEIGDPRALARELSDPSNWMLEIGTPLRPKVQVPSYFSKKGRLLLMSGFLAGIIFSIVLYVAGRGENIILPGLIVLLLGYWLVWASLINDHLGYFALVRELKSTKISLSMISRNELKRSVLILGNLSILMSITIVLVPYLIEPSSLVLSMPLAAVSSCATLLLCVLIWKEGSRILDA